MPKAKPLTKQQKEQFKELYLQGYSASLIFEKLGYPYSPELQNKYQQLMRAYRIRLNLPLRGSGSVPKFKRLAFDKAELSKLKRQQEIKRLKRQIASWTIRIEDWKRLLQTLEADISK